MFNRLRRLRINSHLRNMIQENHLQIENFVYPLFIKFGENIRKEILSMPDVFQLSIDEAIRECGELLNLGIKSIIIFGIPETKDSVGSDSVCDSGIVARAVREIKKIYPEIFIITDLCFCEYTDHGHCGILTHEHNNIITVDNDLTLELSIQQALVQARAGSDMIAPSGMMDGIVETLRNGLDKNGFYNLPIMSYSTKFASGYYGPFRDVAESTPTFGDRKSYQMNPANRREAISESLIDAQQGADILMVKPALAYLDIVRDIRERTTQPIAVYNVSGEYSMLKMAGKLGLIDYERVLLETMISFKRAGADIIISYHAKEIAKILKK